MIGSQINQYKILEKIGSGGQGTVYKALDTKLNRTAVIKILPPELTAKTANFKRFEREAQLCSQLDHANICTIYDFHEANGVFYIAMQYVDGKNVRQLVGGRPLELKSALSIAIQVTDALAYAHSKNIIHRDIKAGNIMVTESGQAKILDFGLAKLLEDEHEEQTRGLDKTEITELGIPYGTATYAAPEQARGERADARSDIFSTGVLLYEMLTGIWAFQGKTVIDVRHQVLYGTPKPIAEMRRDPVPPQLQTIVDKALAKEPKGRYQKISQMRDDLRAVLQEISGAPLMQSDTVIPSHVDSGVFKRALNWFTGKSAPENSTSRPGSASNPPSFIPELSITATSTGTEKKSVAILPFKNLGQEESANFYEFALADAIITELAQLRSLIVRPSSVIAKYQGKDVDPREAGREQRVNAVLSAGFLRGGDKMRVTAQLIDVLTGDILWSDRIDAEGNDILSLQDGIAQRILEGLRLELSDNEQEMLGRRMTENHEAWEEYLRGRDNFGRFIFRTLSADDCDSAIHNFKKAVEYDSHFALAYSGLGACYANRVFKGMGEANDYTLAEAAFSKAFFYDPNVVEARVLMVMIYMARGEKKKARAEIELLQKQFPNEAPLYFVKGVIHRLSGEYDESLKAFEKLSRLDPAARAVSAYNRARIFIYKREYDRAIAELEKGEKAEPDHPMLKIFRSGTYYYRGDVEDAIKLISEVLADNPRMDGIRPLYAMYLAGAGRRDEALAQLTDDALSVSKADHDMAYWVASSYALLGDKDLALKWFNKAIKLGNENKPHFELDKSLDSIRDDPRFAEAMAKIGNGT
ncbi:MAG TPA: protein kinase [Pyrinomonadaceae bacterium]|nr:protein kinase [Chloracidobacterium sp.]HRJ88058.1 protein kinase [Pyrinomonadaceae bacterium]HRK50309.1 protein kinase [Pyrinomonadaceae bacterium]